MRGFVSVLLLSLCLPTLVQADVLSGQRWALQQLHGKTVDAGSGISLSLSPGAESKTLGTIGGFSGCNYFEGSYELSVTSEPVLRFYHLFTSQKRCLGAGDIESRFLLMLTTVDDYELVNGRLQLLVGGVVVAVFD